MAVIMLDMDNLKVINAAYGHAIGDNTLREFSDILSEEARASDTVARYEGNAFVIILPHMQTDSAATALAKRIEHWKCVIPYRTLFCSWRFLMISSAIENGTAS